MSDGVLCHTPVLARHTPSVCQPVTPPWPRCQSRLSLSLSPSWVLLSLSVKCQFNLFISLRVLSPVSSRYHGTDLKTTIRRHLHNSTLSSWLTSHDPFQRWHIAGYLDLNTGLGNNGSEREGNSTSFSVLLSLSLPFSPSLLLTLFFNLTLRVKTSILHQGDVTSCRARGDGSK